MTQLEQTSQTSSVYRSEDEIDLIDLIGFLWKIRHFIASGIILGIVVSVGASFINKQKAENPAIKGLTYAVPLLEDGTSLQGTTSMSAEERITKINEMLSSAETARAFLVALSEAKVLVPKNLESQAALNWFIAQQKNEAEKQKLAKIALGQAGEVVFTGTWSEQVDPKVVATAVVDGLNRMIGTYNDHVTLAQGTKREANLERISNIIHIRTQISAMLFRLAEQLGPVGALNETLIANPTRSPSTTGSDTDWEQVIRILGLLEHRHKINPAQADTEKKQLAVLQEEYLALLPAVTTETPAKKDTIPTGLLYKFHLSPDSTKPDTKTAMILDPETPANGLKSALNKSPVVLVVLGVLLGGFMGVMSGGFWQFWRTNKKRIKEIFAA